MSHWQNIAFSGGGAVAIAYCGVINELSRRGLLEGIERVTGSSSGATFAALVGLRCEPEEIMDFMLSIRNPKTGSKLKDLEDLITQYGLTTADYVIEPLERIIEQKTGKKDTTFAELRDMGSFREIYITGSELARSAPITFSHEPGHMPDLSLSKAVRISNSFPLATVAVEMDGIWYSDGGVTNNFPINLFDSERFMAQDLLRRAEDLETNPGTLGAFSKWPAVEGPQARNVLEFMGQFLFTLLDVQAIQTQNTPSAVERTIFIDNPDFHLTKNWNETPEVKAAMIERGRQATAAYLDNPG